MSTAIGIFLIATNKYREFLPPLVEDIRHHFRPDGMQPRIAIASDIDTGLGDAWHYCPHEPWPLVTLKRYSIMADALHLLSDCPYVFYIDADMRIVSNVHSLVLNRLTAVCHPGYYGIRNPRRLPFEYRLQHAFHLVQPDLPYAAGGFQGGEFDRYYGVCQTLAKLIDDELSVGRIPLWHDESAWNWYLNVRGRDAVFLSPEYCYSYQHAHVVTPRIVALNKNHHEYRAS